MTDIAAVLGKRLQYLLPTAMSVADESHLHRGHAGAKEGAHFRLSIVSRRFCGMPPLARHRLIYQTVGCLVDLGVHALAISAQTPDEAAAAAIQREHT